MKYGICKTFARSCCSNTPLLHDEANALANAGQIVHEDHNVVAISCMTAAKRRRQRFTIQR